MSRRQKILILADEIMRDGPTPRTRLLVEGLAQKADIVLVAQCYLVATHRARRPGFPVAYYGFAAECYEARILAFAAELVARHKPDLVLAYGWENAKLAVALDELDIPIVSFVDYMTDNPTGQGQLNRIFRHATEIVLHQMIPPQLTLARWGLDARVYDVTEIRLDAIDVKTRGSFAWLRGRATAAGGGTGAGELQGLLDRLGQTCTRAAASGSARERDRLRIEASDLFNRDLHEPDDTRTKAQALGAYLRASRFAIPRDRVLSGRIVRRPLEGFHPLIYASDNPAFDEASGEDPFAHWLRTGRPHGRWTHDLIRPGVAPTPEVRAAIHIHLHYPDLLAEFLDRLATNVTPTDLFITTTSEGGLSEIRQILRASRMDAKIVALCPNLGRDLWPFLELLGAGTFGTYDILGHFHGKRSPHTDTGAGWRGFLWSHLVGGDGAMVDAIAARFAADPTLGLAFAEEPHLEGWEINKDIATDLARRAGIATPLPNHFDYPMGTMFWARPAALAPLLALGLTPADIPPEPLAVDGTMLHALERLIPFFVEKAGYRYATTYVRGSRR